MSDKIYYYISIHEWQIAPVQVSEALVGTSVHLRLLHLCTGVS
jgi:hypothetical protein